MDVKIKQVVQRVFNELPNGRVASWESMACHMMELVVRAGNGDHVEIGVLHGGSLIMTALTKQEFGLSGTVYGVDPLDGYYPADPMNNPNGYVNAQGILLTNKVDVKSGTPVTREILQKNIDYFGLADRIEIVHAFSYPWPEQLENKIFISAYIDGNHNGDGPLYDWQNIKQRVQVGGLVWFDNCMADFPGVVAAVEIVKQEPDWKEISYHQNYCFATERIA